MLFFGIPNHNMFLCSLPSSTLWSLLHEYKYFRLWSHLLYLTSQQTEDFKSIPNLILTTTWPSVSINHSFQIILLLNKYILAINYVQDTRENRGVKNAFTQGADDLLRGGGGWDTRIMITGLGYFGSLHFSFSVPSSKWHVLCFCFYFFNICKASLSLLLSGLQRHKFYKNSFSTNTQTNRKVE